MLGTKQGEQLYRFETNYTMFDLETTGLDTITDKIVEIGALKVREGEIIGELDILVNPECEIPQQVVELHGISNPMVEDAPKIDEALKMFNCFIGEDIVLGQNIAAFDLPFIWRESEECFGKIIANNYIDSLWLARRALPDAESHSLKNLGELFGVERINAHRALYDCRRTKQIYDKLGKILKRTIW